MKLVQNNTQKLARTVHHAKFNNKKDGVLYLVIGWQLSENTLKKISRMTPIM